MKPITRLFDFAYYQLETHNLEDALITKKDGNWIKTSTKAYLDKANTLSRALLKLGVQKGDKIAVISTNNRTEWCIVDVGVLCKDRTCSEHYRKCFTDYDCRVRTTEPTVRNEACRAH